MPIVVATYNVHQCVGSDGRRDPARIADVIRETKADVIALQEVDSRTGVEHGVDQFNFLAEATEMRPIAGPTLQDHRGHYGNAILTRMSVLRQRSLDLSVPGREPRGALDVVLTAAGHELRMIATHLGLRWRERRRQVATLVDLIGTESREPLVLLGDMNEWIPIRHSLAPLFQMLGHPPRRRTFPAHRPLLPLDRIWCRPSEAVSSIHVHRSERARIASDHLPLKAEVRLGGTERSPG